MSASTFCAVRFGTRSDRKICADANVCLNMWEPDKIRARYGFKVKQHRLLYPLFSTIANETNHKGMATQIPKHLQTQA